MNTLSLASRNLLRNRRRSAMTLTAMVLGLVTVLLFGGYIRDIDYGLQTDFVQLTGHLQLQHKDYFQFGSGNPAAYGVAHYERIVDTVKKDPVIAPMLAVVTPILQIGGIAGNFAAGVSRPVYVTGTVVEDQNRMREWNDYRFPTLTRRLSLSGTAPDSAVIGTGVARVLQLCTALNVPDCATEAAKVEASAPELSDDISALAGLDKPAKAAPVGSGHPRIELLAANARGAPNVAAVNVLSAEFQGIKELDDVYIGLHLSQAQKLVYGSAPPQVTAIAIQLHRTAQLPEARKRLDELLASTLKGEPLAVLDYETLNPYYGQARSMFAAIFGFIAVLIGAIVLFTVTNTMGMAVVERTAEIGTLRAIGQRRGDIRRMFVTEGLVLGCVGATLGILAALVLAATINEVGLTWLPPGRIEPIPLAVRVAGEHGMLIASAAVLVVVAAVSAVVPAARAARMNIVEALRHA
ncbi:MAG: ABC transporter permease [Burkholderiaceae bacterium]|nr:ABC transporter permease [Burkholderiaceae bacterium]